MAEYMKIRETKHYKVRRNHEKGDFLRLYRFREDTLLWMSDYFLGKDCERRGSALTSLEKMKIFCRYMADPGFQTGVAEDLGVHQSTVSRQIHSVMDSIIKKRDIWIHFPTSQEEIQESKILWQENKSMPSTIGAIDCTHVRIDKPPGVFGDEYVNRKGYASIIVQATCNARFELTSLDVSWPGSVHDSRVLRNSDLFLHLRDSKPPVILLGDEGYPLYPFLMTPFKVPRSEKQTFYNKTHAKERVVIEQTFGQLKRRFPMLRYGLRLKLESVPTAITCCAILHNIAKYFNEPDPIDDEENVEPDEDMIDITEMLEITNQAESRRLDIVDILFNRRNIRLS